VVIMLKPLIKALTNIFVLLLKYFQARSSH